MSRKHRSEPQTSARREFLKGVVAGSGAAAVALLSGAANAQPEPGAPATAAPTESKGYRVTQHILDYYKTASE